MANDPLMDVLVELGNFFDDKPISFEITMYPHELPRSLKAELFDRETGDKFGMIAARTIEELRDKMILNYPLLYQAYKDSQHDIDENKKLN